MSTVHGIVLGFLIYLPEPAAFWGLFLAFGFVFDAPSKAGAR